MVVADDDQPIRRATIVACSFVVSFRQQLGPGMPEDISVEARFICDDPNRPDEESRIELPAVVSSPWSLVWPDANSRDGSAVRRG